MNVDQQSIPVGVESLAMADIEPIKLDMSGLMQMGLGIQRNRLEEQRFQASEQKAEAHNSMLYNLEVIKSPDFSPIQKFQAVNSVAGKVGIGKIDPGEYTRAQSDFDGFVQSAATLGPQAPETQSLLKGLLNNPAAGLFREHAKEQMALAQHNQVQQGMQSLASGALGRPATTQEGAAVAASPQLQTKTGEATMQSPLEQAKTQALKGKMADLTIQEGELSQAQQHILGYATPAMDLQSELAYVGKLIPGGKPGPASAALIGTPIYDSIAAQTGTLSHEERQQLQTQTKADIQQLSGQRKTLQAELRNAQYSTGETPTRSLTAIQSELEAVKMGLQVKQAEQSYSTNPTAQTLQELTTAYGTVDGQLTSIKQQVTAIRNAKLGIATSGSTEEKTREFDVKQAYDAKVGKAQQELATIGRNATDLQAAKIAEKHGVKVSDVLPAIKDPNRIPIAITMSQEKETAKVIGGGIGKAYNQITESGLEASNKLNNLDRMDQLLQGVDTGKLTPSTTQISALAKSLGFDIDPNLDAKQAIDALSNDMALRLRNPSGGAGMPGAMSDSDRVFLTNMVPGLAKTPGGNKLMIETARKVAQRVQEVAKMARAYKKAHGGEFDDGFFDQLQTYANEHPLFSPKVGSVENGYRFKGGIANDRNNWVKE